MKTLIVDDEPIARRILREELELLPGVAVIAEAADGREALQKIAELTPDLVFLDLQMPVMGGFDVVRCLDGHSAPVVVMVTAFDQHAIQAFEAGAIDYLLKPIRQERLRKSVERARKLRRHPQAVAENIVKIATTPDDQQAPRGRRIVGKSGSEYFLLDPNDVLAFQADGELVWIITAKNRFLASQSLRMTESRLEKSQFQRVHRNAIVNVNHVRKMSPLSSQRWLLTLTNQQQLVVSKRQAQNIRTTLQW
jgi:two-component system, LytTR family, response regulator